MAQQMLNLVGQLVARYQALMEEAADAQEVKFVDS